ncbi:MAG: lysoplasmalogenase [Saprospiraceae bacterium]
MSLLRALFFLLAAVNLTAEYYQQELIIYLTKPLLVSTLAVYFLLQTHGRRGTSERFIVYGLFFSVLGDTLLMFVENGAGNDLLFALGLGSFLITHVFYVLAFHAYQSMKNGFLQREKWWVMPFFTYLFINTFILYPDVPTELKIPVVIYSCTITLMALSAFNLKGFFPKDGFPWLLAAVLLFVFSDTIIGWNKFKTATITIPHARLLIMIPYLASQYLLVTTWQKYMDR